MLQKVIFSFVLSMIFSVTLLPGQVSESLYEAQLDSLKAAFPNCHVEAEELETAFFCALSFYPEFKDASIVVRYGKVSSSMLCRPEPVSVFSKGRKYKILVNKNRSDKAFPLNAGFSALTGCFGHELAHVARYEAQTDLAIIRDGIKYVFNRKFRSEYEKETDIITARKGLGFENYEYESFFISHSKISPELLASRYEIYYDTKGLMRLFKHHSRRKRVIRPLPRLMRTPKSLMASKTTPSSLLIKP